MSSRIVFPDLWAGLGLCAAVAASAMSCPAFATEPEAEIPAWLAPHVGAGPDQAAEPVLRRARALYLRKRQEGTVTNPCFFAMDATRPNTGSAEPGGRFYVVCEDQRSFTAIAAGHGSGRDLGGAADFANGRRCARNFGNALDSELTTGGIYVTGEIRTSFKGYYRAAASRNVAFSRAFIPFEGEGETANAVAREIGGHAAVTLKNVCLRKAPGDPHANPDGYVPQGTLVDYSGGRSNGCTSWSAPDARQIGAMVQDAPTTLYIYPEAEDVRAVARAVAAHQSPAAAGAYWDAACLREIGAPKYWSRATLEPIIARYKQTHPAPPPRPTPICTGP